MRRHVLQLCWFKRSALTAFRTPLDDSADAGGWRACLFLCFQKPTVGTLQGCAWEARA